MWMGIFNVVATTRSQHVRAGGMLLLRYNLGFLPLFILGDSSLSPDPPPAVPNIDQDRPTLMCCANKGAGDKRFYEFPGNEVS
jgi:hypothetical protein